MSSNDATGAVPASMTRIGDGVYLTPSDAAMTRSAMTDWLRLRGVADADMDRELDEYAGKTEDEMDEMYDALHEV